MFQSSPGVTWLTETDWGLYYDARTGFFYSTFPQDGSDNNFSGPGGGAGPFINRATIYRYRVDDFGDGMTNCIDPFITYQDGVVGVGDRELPNINMLGITTDADGNLYVVATGFMEPGQLLKYDATGAFVAASAIDNVNGDGGFWAARGVVYSESSNLLYVSTQVNSTPRIVSLSSILT